MGRYCKHKSKLGKREISDPGGSIVGLQQQNLGSARIAF
jgi:hypothetical protein